MNKNTKQRFAAKQKAGFFKGTQSKALDNKPKVGASGRDIEVKLYGGRREAGEQ